MEGRKNLTAASSSSSDVASGESCVICMSTIEKAKRTQINCCSHVFCYECIHAWSKEKSICPLCKRIFSEMSFLRAATIVTEKVECVYQPPASHDGPALDCLDSQYFLGEISRLLATAEQTQRTWFKERRQNPAMYRHKHSSTHQERHWDLLEESINRLHFLRIQLTGDGDHEIALAISISAPKSATGSSAPSAPAQRRSTPQFDSFVMLQELYQLQETLQEIYSARCFVNNPQQQQQTPTRHSNQYDFGDEEDEEEEYEDEDYYYEEDNDRNYVAAATAATRRLALSDYVKSPTQSKSKSNSKPTTPTKASPTAKPTVVVTSPAKRSAKRP